MSSVSVEGFVGRFGGGSETNSRRGVQEYMSETKYRIPTFAATWQPQASPHSPPPAPSGAEPGPPRAATAR